MHEKLERERNFLRGIELDFGFFFLVGRLTIVEVHDLFHKMNNVLLEI